MIFVSDSENKVHRINMDDKTMTENIYPAVSHPGAIAIDWLHNYTYLVDGVWVSYLQSQFQKRVDQGCTNLVKNSCLLAVLQYIIHIF